MKIKKVNKTLNIIEAYSKKLLSMTKAILSGHGPYINSVNVSKH